jgi:hypothetical protein
MGHVPTKTTTVEVVFGPKRSPNPFGDFVPMSLKSSPEHRVLHASSIVAFPCCLRARARTHDPNGVPRASSFQRHRIPLLS